MGGVTSDIWDPNRPVTQPILDQFAKVKDNYGIHVYYPFGWLKDLDLALPTPYHHGITGRSFWFCGDYDATTEMRVYEDGQVDKTYISCTVIKNILYYKTSGGSAGIKSIKTRNKLVAGQYYSFAIQMYQDKLFKLIFNETVLYEADMTKISGRKWRVKITTGEHYVWSIHYTNELNASIPSSGLGPSYWLQGIKLQVGTTVKFQGQVLRFNDTDVIEAKFGPPDLKISFKSSYSYKNTMISFILKRTVESFLLVMNFTTEGATRFTPTEEPYKSGEIDPVFSNSFRLMTVYIGWGQFTM